MKRFTTYLTFIALFCSIQIISVMAMKKENIKQSETSPKYAVKLDVLNSFFFDKPIATQILIEVPTKKIIARFQPPDTRKYDTFNSNQRFLLILSAIWTPVYDQNPKLFEWHLFDTEAKKTIKKFPRESYPVFDERNNQIVCERGYPSFPLPTEPAQSFFDATMKTFKNSFSWLFTKLPQNASATTTKTITRSQNLIPQTQPTAPQALAFASHLFSKQETAKDFIPSLNRKRILDSRIKTESEEKPSPNEKKEEIATDNNNDDYDDDEELFESVIEESMHTFKQYIDKSELQNALSSIDDIITELATEDEIGSLDNQATVITNYRQYPPAIQKKFTTKLLEQYKKCSQDIKEQCATTLFSTPYGDLYKPKNKEKNEIKNRLNNVAATIETVKINNQNQDILTITSIATQKQLLKYPLMQSIKVKTFSESGKKFALSYEKKLQGTHTTIVVFTQEHNTIYMPKIYLIQNSPEIIGLLFLDDFTLFTLDENYSMAVINLPKNQ